MGIMDSINFNPLSESDTSSTKISLKINYLQYRILFNAAQVNINMSTIDTMRLYVS